MTTSATGGYIQPAPPPAPTPLQDEALEDFFQQIVVGLSGLAGQFVHPAWQEEPPNLPNVGKDWAALAVQEIIPDTYGVEIHDGAGEGSNDFQRHETINMLVSFYGPNAGRISGLFRDGLQISTNRAVLSLAGMGLVETGPVLRAPVLSKAKWLNRYDCPWVVRRAVQRTYPVLNLRSMLASLVAADTGAAPNYIEVPMNVSQP